MKIKGFEDFGIRDFSQEVVRITRRIVGISRIVATVDCRKKGPLPRYIKVPGPPAAGFCFKYGSAAMNTAAKETPFSHVPVMVSHETLTFSALQIREIVFLRVGGFKGKLKLALDTHPA